MTVVCRVTRVITVARLLARTPSQKTERTFHFYTHGYTCAHLDYTTGAIGISPTSPRDDHSPSSISPLYRSSPRVHDLNSRFWSNQLALSFTLKKFPREVYYRAVMDDVSFFPSAIMGHRIIIQSKNRAFINRRGEEIRFVSRKKHNDAFRIA